MSLSCRALYLSIMFVNALRLLVRLARTDSNVRVAISKNRSVITRERGSHNMVKPTEAIAIDSTAEHRQVHK